MRRHGLFGLFKAFVAMLDQGVDIVRAAIGNSYIGFVLVRIGSRRIGRVIVHIRNLRARQPEITAFPYSCICQNACRKA